MNWTKPTNIKGNKDLALQKVWSNNLKKKNLNWEKIQTQLDLLLNSTRPSSNKLRIMLLKLLHWTERSFRKTVLLLWYQQQIKHHNKTRILYSSLSDKHRCKTLRIQDTLQKSFSKIKQGGFLSEIEGQFNNLKASR